MKLQTKLCRHVLLGVAALAVMVPGISQAHGWKHKHNRQKEIVGYFIEWGIYGRNYRVKNIVDSGSAEKLTVINYAFGNVAPDAEGNVVCKLGDEWADYQTPWTAEQSVTGEAVNWPNPILGNFQQLKALKEIYPNIKVVISLGGWTWSKYFSDAALTEESRKSFVSSCIDLFIHGNLPDPGWGGMGGPGAAAGVFDGIDVDWEWPATEGHPDNIVRPEDKQNFTKLLAEFRKQLDEVNPDLLLTIASGAPKRVYSNMELNKIHKYLDFISIMAYDFHLGTQPNTNHQANLLPPHVRHDSTLPDDYNDHSVHGAVQGYLRGGVPEHKLVVGVPFYSRGWTGVNNARGGLLQPAQGPAAGTFEAGIEDYKVVKDLVVAGYDRHWDWIAQSAWLFDGNTFWTFDDPAVMCIKSKYVQIRRLRGVMFWELSGDDAQGSLISSLDRCLDRPRGWAWGHWK